MISLLCFAVSFSLGYTFDFSLPVLRWDISLWFMIPSKLPLALSSHYLGVISFSNLQLPGSLIYLLAHFFMSNWLLSSISSAGLTFSFLLLCIPSPHISLTLWTNGVMKIYNIEHLALRELPVSISLTGHSVPPLVSASCSQCCRLFISSSVAMGGELLRREKSRAVF